MKYKIPKLIVLILKLGVFLSLSIIFYVYYFSDVARKYRDENTYLSKSHETVTDIKVPILTLCLNDPIARMSVLKKYNLTVKALDEPTINEQKTLKNMNKTVMFGSIVLAWHFQVSFQCPPNFHKVLTSLLPLAPLHVKILT